MLDPSQLSHFRERQVKSLSDTCHRLIHSYDTNELNEKVSRWTEDHTDIKCGLLQSGNERNRTNDTLLNYDAIIRLPLSEIWDVKDQIKITKRYGEDLDIPLIYAIASPIQRGPSGIQLKLKRVENSVESQAS